MDRLFCLLLFVCWYFVCVCVCLFVCLFICKSFPLMIVASCFRPCSCMTCQCPVGLPRFPLSMPSTKTIGVLQPPIKFKLGKNRAEIHGIFDQNHLIFGQALDKNIRARGLTPPPPQRDLSCTPIW